MGERVADDKDPPLVDHFTDIRRIDVWLYLPTSTMEKNDQNVGITMIRIL